MSLATRRAFLQAQRGLGAQLLLAVSLAVLAGEMAPAGEHQHISSQQQLTAQF